MICKKRFQEALFNVHQCSGVKTHECNICEKIFTKKQDLADHKRIHTGEKPYECKICKKAFNSSSDLTRHKRVHTGELETFFM